MIDVRIDNDGVTPGDEITGEVHWTAEKDCTPKKITVSLGWRTEGRGDADRDVVASADQDGGPVFAGDVTKIPFRVRVPADACPGFAGTLVRLVWFVGVRVDLPWAIDEKAEVEVGVGPARLATSLFDEA